jgi:Ca-activated chloride channel homolog
MILHLEQPWILILAVVIFVAALIVSRAQIVRGVTGVLRSVALLVLAFAASSPNLETARAGLVILTDVSDSASPAPQALAQIPASSRLEFAGQAGVAGTPRDALETSQTDVGNALQVAQAYEGTRVLLVSDGNSTTSNALERLPGVPVDVLPLTSRQNASVADLIAPNSLTKGATARATAVIGLSQAARVRILPSLNGAPLPVQTLTLPAGRSSIGVDFVVPDPGEAALEVKIEPNFEQPKLDDSKTLSLRVEGRGNVLVIGDPAMSKLLRGQGFVVREGTPASILEPLSASAIIIRGAATDYSRGQLQLLERFVNDGGGLMFTGGAKSFGLGGWARTKLEELMPVASDLRTRVDVPLVAMVMIVDRSLSMMGSSGNAQKLELALEGVSNVIELANPKDLLGLITFSDTAKWVFKPIRATDNNKLQMIRAVQDVQPEGGTILGPAYTQAIQALKDRKASIKHIILLTDGQLADAEESNPNPPDFPGMAKAANDAGITTSSIAVGSDADVPRLKAIAKAGKGRYYEALQIDTLPRIFTTEALTATRSVVRLEVFKPTLVRHPLARVSSRPPALSAYIATTLHPEAEAILVGLDREPVLAVTRKGLGRTAALTVDLSRNDAFTRWAELPNLLGTITRWLELAPTPYSLALSQDGSNAIVDAVDSNRYLNNQRLELRVGGKSLNMTQTAPGRYEAQIPKEATGSLVLVKSGAVLARTSLQSKNRELETGNGLENLRRIAQASGGRMLENLTGYEASRKTSGFSLAPWLAVLGGLLLVLELAYRRFRL